MARQHVCTFRRFSPLAIRALANTVTGLFDNPAARPPPLARRRLPLSVRFQEEPTDIPAPATAEPALANIPALLDPGVQVPPHPPPPHASQCAVRHVAQITFFAMSSRLLF